MMNSDLDMAGLNREASVFVPRRCRSGYEEYERLGRDIGIDDRVKPALCTMSDNMFFS